MNLVWHNTEFSKSEELRDQTIANLKHMLEDLDGDPSRLVFHHIFLTRDYKGPCVFVWGEKGSDAFHCEYCEKPEWKTGAEIDAEKNASTEDITAAKISKED